MRLPSTRGQKAIQSSTGAVRRSRATLHMTWNKRLQIMFFVCFFTPNVNICKRCHFLQCLCTVTTLWLGFGEGWITKTSNTSWWQLIQRRTLMAHLYWCIHSVWKSDTTTRFFKPCYIKVYVLMWDGTWSWLVVVDFIPRASSLPSGSLPRTQVLDDVDQ